MRDPERIKRMTEKLRAAWEMRPDMRLGQMLVNLISNDEDMFYFEDDKTEAALDEWLNMKIIYRKPTVVNPEKTIKVSKLE